MAPTTAGIVLTAAWTALAAWLLTPVFAQRARERGWVDRPSPRKSHAAPVPAVGGIALAAALAAGLGLSAAAGSLDVAHAVWGGLVVGAFAIGLADDRGRLETREKLAAQVLLAGFAGVALDWAGAPLGPFGPMRFGWLAPLMSAAWVFAVMTVVNFLDGIDLIVVGVATVLLGVGIGCGAGPGGGLMLVLVVGALLGVAFWNVTPARVFLGDAGSHVLGLVIALLPMGLRGDPGAVRVVPWALAAAPLLPAVVDVGLGIADKVRHGIPVHRPHKDHLYQRLTRAGRSHAAAALRYAVLCLAGVGLVAAAPRLGLPATLAAATLVLAAHLGEALWATRDVPRAYEDAT